MSKQSSIFSFFSKSPAGNKKTESSPTSKNVKLKGKEYALYDLVWARLDGYPWWPALISLHPSEKAFIRKSQIHVQFFDDPPTRAWIKDVMVKPYGAAVDTGIPKYKDPKWSKSVARADKAVQMPREERSALIVEILSDDEEEPMETDEENNASDQSKENVDGNINKENCDSKSAGGKPEKKKRRIVIVSDSDASEEEYKPAKDEVADDDESESSGESEKEESEISEIDSPVKKLSPKKRKRPTETSKPAMKSLNSSFASPSSKITSSITPSTPSTPKLSQATKSKLGLFAAAESTPSKAGDPMSIAWPHTKLTWLYPESICDKEGHRPDHPDYSQRTVKLPEEFLYKQTPAMRQWWDMKSNYFDTILFFKMGKFYELFHMDAIIGVRELGLLMMKGEHAHVGFPEISYGRYSSSLIEKGYKVARIEQTETPYMMEQRCKSTSHVSKFDKVVRREVCQVTSIGTRVYNVLDGEPCGSNARYLYAITEKPLSSVGEKRQFGLAFVDTSIGIFHLAQFVDDLHLSRLRTLMSHRPPVQVLTERGKISKKCQQLINSTVALGMHESLCSDKEFWGAGKTLGFLAEASYFQGQNAKAAQGMVWPEGLKQLIDESDSLGKSPKSDHELGVSCLGALVWYLQSCRLDEELISRGLFEWYDPMDTVDQPESIVVEPDFIAHRRHMILDGTSLRNLEIFENSSNGGREGTLIERLDKCFTASGKRLLRNYMCAPLCSVNGINSRLDAVEDLLSCPEMVDSVTILLKGLPDLERLLSKIYGQGINHSSNHPDTRAIFFEDEKYSKRKVMDLLTAVNGFRTASKIVTSFQDIYGGFKSSLLRQCVSSKENGGNFPELNNILEFFDTAFDHAEAKKEGKIIPSIGVDSEFDEAGERVKKVKQNLAEYLKEQCKYFGAKVEYWGSDKKRFQLEVPESASRKAGDEYELVSQKKTHKRFWTETTRQYLQEMMLAEEQREAALRDIARRIFRQFSGHADVWKAAVECISVLDVLLSFLKYSQENNTTRPEVVMPGDVVTPFIDIRDGCHPCAIKIYSGDDYIPNDVIMGDNNEQSHAPLVLVTGPNMGGKSTLMRQTALICILAQLGCPVPASSCRLTPIDRIFTRLGAQDRIMMGESTFFVEMAETSSIIRHATNHSLVIVDELGRGTATYDGTAIASAVVDRLVMMGCRCLFSTHYHFLVDDFAGNPGVSLGHMACMVENENESDLSKETITFLYKFVEGSCPKSYGFNAARLAALPEEIIRVGSSKAREFEQASMQRRMFVRLLQTIAGKVADVPFVGGLIKQVASIREMMVA